MRITIQNYSSTGVLQLGASVLGDDKAGRIIADFRINGQKLVQPMAGVRAREVIQFGRKNRSSRIAFLVEQTLANPALAGSQIVTQQDLLSDAELQVLGLSFDWSGSTIVRYCLGSLAEVDGGYIVGSAIRFSYVFEGGRLSSTVPPYPSNR